jgi:hypothetical protein
VLKVAMDHVPHSGRLDPRVKKLAESNVFPIYAHFDNQIWSFPAVTLTAFGLSVNILKDSGLLADSNQADKDGLSFSIISGIFLVLTVVNMLVSFIFVRSRINQKPFKYFRVCLEIHG